jgi:transposase
VWNEHLRALLAWVGLVLPVPARGRGRPAQPPAGPGSPGGGPGLAAQLRLCGRFRRLAARKDSKNLVVTAIARELTGFLWAEMAA